MTILEKLQLKFIKYFAMENRMHIRLHSRCGTDLGRSIAVVTYNILANDVVQPVYVFSTFPLTATAV